MKIFTNIGLYFRTIKHLKPIQIFYRIYRFLDPPKLISYSTLDRSNFIFPKYANHLSNNDLETKFSFLNHRIDLSFPKDWNNKEIPLLWLYNLHYFNDLLASNISISKKNHHIYRWINDNPSKIKGPGWDPYTLSLRIVNWIKFFSNEKLNSNKVITSLIEQVRFLDKSIEYHVLANHVLENAKALIFAGLFFNGKEAQYWLNKGIKILEKELKEQILEDGAHFELSPMYHSIIFDLVLDIYELTSVSDHPKHNSLIKIKYLLEDSIIKMSHWLGSMTHPDGEIPYFNDSVVGVAKQPEFYLSRAKELLPNTKTSDYSDIISFKDSGYIRVSKRDFILFFKCSDVKPSYQPGHAHADTLSVELSHHNQRVFVNLGTSIYEAGERRDLERATKSHTTLEVDGKNSSEVWSSFRVGRRAKILESNIIQNHDFIEISGKHNGYRYIKKNLTHSRILKIMESSVQITDRLNVQNYSGISRFHLHPDINVECDYEKKIGTLILPDATKIFWKAECKNIFIEDTQYASAFGVLKDTKTLALYDNNFSSSSITLEI